MFDCLAKFMGKSLNDMLYKGPDLTSSLVGVLLRFREERVAVMAEIESMFHQVTTSEFTITWWFQANQMGQQ